MSSGFSSAVRRLIEVRAGEFCELCLVRPPAQMHHRCSRQMGGSDNTPWMNLASNGLYLCGTSASGCHGWATSYLHLAASVGVVVPRGVADQLGGCGPVPFTDHFERAWWLHPDGRKIRFSIVTSAPEGLT